ncbi:hypothetical protein HIV01_011405 [Lysobacter arenosi]|uniref:Uncharacterized protein n=2 Tax=Lysobacter arenosi TaxID=2795387 RepID=A0ABX7R6T7_9GAMM|nr:hypothetical protein [Lysobacter arenosi]QSX73838.1 hypothetical protein HIV01_011405 [Lysobacter arenosi]
MSTRAQLDVRLDELALMLPPWLARLRHEEQFWPQFNALAQQILDQAEADDQSHVLQRLDAMLTEHQAMVMRHQSGSQILSMTPCP